MRWVSREVGYARYESPSEMFHSLIFSAVDWLLTCMLVVSYEIFPISKISPDFKNSKTKMCFRPF